jgi:hypothetical protein
MAIKRNIQYINKDFTEFRNNLINYARTYFPTTYNDFSPSSPGMMFMEMASYVGDVLSFYTDNQIQETFLQYSRQTNNLYELAYMFGYKPNVTQVATTTIDLYQQLPSKLSGSTYIPDFDYSLLIEENASSISSNSPNISFLIEESVDFSYSSSLDPTEVSIFSVDGSGNPTYFLLKKSKKAISADILTTTFTFGSPEPYSTVNINNNNIVGILDVVDSNGNNWYEVDYLGQEMIYNSIKNTNPNDPNLSTDLNNTPYLLKLDKKSKKFKRF